MYINFKNIKKKLESNVSINDCFEMWRKYLMLTVDYFYDKEIYDDENHINPSKFKKSSTFVKDVLKTLNLFKDKINVKKDSTIIKVLGMIAGYGLYLTRVIDIPEKDLVCVLDYLDWNYSIISEKAENWVSSEEEAGYNIIEFMELAEKYNKNITGYNDVSGVYSLLMAVYHCNYEKAEKFIIDKKIKLPDGMEFEDAMIGDMIEYFEEKGYDLVN